MIKGTFPDWAKQEIIDFFQTKHMSVEAVLRDFSAHSFKAEQCSIDIVLNKSVMERRAVGIDPIDRILTVAHFELITMPGCCGIVISTNAWVLCRINGYGIGQFLHNLRLRIAKEWGYGVIMCTDVDDNVKQKHILEKNKWKHIKQFRNPRTMHTVNIHTLDLYE